MKIYSINFFNPQSFESLNILYRSLLRRLTYRNSYFTLATKLSINCVRVYLICRFNFEEINFTGIPCLYKMHDNCPIRFLNNSFFKYNRRQARKVLLIAVRLLWLVLVRSLLHCFRSNDVGVHNSLLVYGNNSG